jgi:hypothetical protein
LAENRYKYDIHVLVDQTRKTDTKPEYSPGPTICLAPVAFNISKVEL